MKYLEFHYECLKTGNLPTNGLCRCLGESNIEIMVPTNDDLNRLKEEKLPIGYWGCDNIDWTDNYDYDYLTNYTPLRQNIVLFIAAMNGELDSPET